MFLTQSPPPTPKRTVSISNKKEVNLRFWWQCSDVESVRGYWEDVQLVINSHAALTRGQ